MSVFPSKNTAQKTVRRLCVFAHYDKDGIVDPYVYAYLKALRPFMERIIFVSVSISDHFQASEFTDMGVEVITRDNIGHDFMSWKLALSGVNFQEYDELFQVNDS